MLLFAGIYFTKLVPSNDKQPHGSLCLVQVSNMIKFDESVYHALEYVKGRVLVSLWQSGFIIVDKVSGQGITKIKDSLPANINCRGFQRIPGFDIDTFPFVISISNLSFNIINVKLGFSQTFISEKCDLNWYQTPFALTQANEAAEFSVLFVRGRDLYQMNCHSDFVD